MLIFRFLNTSVTKYIVRPRKISIVITEALIYSIISVKIQSNFVSLIIFILSSADCGNVEFFPYAKWQHCIPPCEQKVFGNTSLLYTTLLFYVLGKFKKFQQVEFGMNRGMNLPSGKRRVYIDPDRDAGSPSVTTGSDRDADPPSAIDPDRDDADPPSLSLDDDVGWRSP
jgi:hypothetical protein